VITHPGSVVVMPVLQDGRIILIRQYRHAARQFLWELVAGRMDPGESVRQAAARELMEETGYRAKRFRVFLDLFPTPGFLEERMYILLAKGLTLGKAEPEEDEKIDAKAYTRGELEKMIQRGVLRDAKSIAGLLYYFRFLA
jgi:ADP-ribose pyrophosphatase